GESRCYIPRRHKRERGFQARRKRTRLDLTKIVPKAYGHHGSQTEMVNHLLEAMKTSGVLEEYPDPRGRLDYQSTCALHDDDPDKLAQLKRLVEQIPRRQAKPRPAASRDARVRTPNRAGSVTKETAQVGTPNRAADHPDDEQESRRLGHQAAQVGT